MGIYEASEKQPISDPSHIYNKVSVRQVYELFKAAFIKLCEKQISSFEERVRTFNTDGISDAKRSTLSLIESSIRNIGNQLDQYRSLQFDDSEESMLAFQDEEMNVLRHIQYFHQTNKCHEFDGKRDYSAYVMPIR